MIHATIADFHCHTLVSQHAYSTTLEYAAEAEQKKLAAIAITDHGPLTYDGATEGHFRNLHVLPRFYHGVRIFRGAEANIIDYTGKIDLEDSTLDRLDFVIASLHEEAIKPSTVDNHTKAYTNVIQNPHVAILGHIGTEAFPCDYESVIAACKSHNVAIEINDATFQVRKSSIENCMKVASICKQLEAKIIVNSDAHIATSVGGCQNALSMLRQVQFPEELIINMKREQLQQWLLDRGIIQ